MPELSNIKHPLEGIAYIAVLAVFVRWLWPVSWNSFLKLVRAKDPGASTSKKSN